MDSQKVTTLGYYIKVLDMEARRKHTVQEFSVKPSILRSSPGLGSTNEGVAHDNGMEKPR